MALSHSAGLSGLQAVIWHESPVACGGGSFEVYNPMAKVRSPSFCFRFFKVVHPAGPLSVDKLRVDLKQGIGMELYPAWFWALGIHHVDEVRPR
ncbi:hypothetical protein SAMN02745887_01910 [Chitinimonas taiwanensis DSM 18899]|uniref:Uncharacterized protein n=1 Tax=Chitinimonas taiwanensis DSM 18899 TaxID=1121279 RepID=A0A1K2HIU7_9NEIS|nr:hypothetical protein SAMN02745887_01910 [Chitinimonas taiwanensis DSM 18899]